jgi:HEPN domain-containing protein
MATCADLARRLLDAARDDELMASSLLPVKGVTDAGIGLHAQQAVEKAIKAVLTVKETEFPFTHDLERLREFAKKSEIDLPTTLNGIEALTPFARDERYGSEPRSVSTATKR